MNISNQPGVISFQFVSDSSLLIQLHSYPSVEASKIILNLFELLQERKLDWQLTNLHPAYCSLLVDFDVQNLNPEDLKNKIEKLAQNLKKTQSIPAEVVEIPVNYGGENGADLEEVASLKGLSTAEVIRLHSEALYTVSFIGFAPGFPYLLGLPEKLICPRKKNPRTRVPAGSVAIAGNQTGIYPTDSPGGWQLIGRTGKNLFDPNRRPVTLLKPGDQVRFIPTNHQSLSGTDWNGSPHGDLLLIQLDGTFSSRHCKPSVLKKNENSAFNGHFKSSCLFRVPQYLIPCPDSDGVSRSTH